MHVHVGSIVFWVSCFFFDFAVNFFLSIPIQVIAWRTVSEMTCNVSSGMLNLTHSLRNRAEKGPLMSSICDFEFGFPVSEKFMPTMHIDST